MYTEREGAREIQTDQETYRGRKMRNNRQTAVC